MLLLLTAGVGSLHLKRGTIGAPPTTIGTKEGTRGGLPHVNHLAADPWNTQRIFMATDAGIFISMDGGRVWHSYNRGLKTLSVGFIAPDPHRKDVVWAAGRDGGLYRSADGGGSWQPAGEGIADRSITQVVFHPREKDVIFAVGLQGGVFKSDDGGKSWRAENSGLEEKLSAPQAISFSYLAIAPVAPGDKPVLFLGTSAGTFRREEGAARWEDVGGALRGIGITALTALPGTGMLMAGAAFQSGVFVSSDGGRTWQPRGGGLEKDTVHHLTLDPADPGVVYAAAPPSSGIIRSADGGATWRQANPRMKEAAWGRILVAVPGTGGTLFAVTGERINWLYRSDDGGLSWAEPVAAFPPLEEVRSRFRLARPD